MRRLRSRALATVPLLARHSALVVPPRQPLHVNDEFLSGTSAVYLESLMEDFERDPSSVDPSFHSVLRNMQARPLHQPALDQAIRAVDHSLATQQVQDRSYGIAQSLCYSRRILSLVRTYEAEGHLFATLDPLQFEEDPVHRVPSKFVSNYLRLKHEAFGLSDEDLDKTFALGFHDGLGGIFDRGTAPLTLRELIAKMQAAYCGNIGYEFMHIYDENVCHWFREHIEYPQRVAGNPLVSKLNIDHVYQDLADSVLFENFLKTKFHPAKRFGSDGSETFLVGMKALIERASLYGVEEVVMGQAHRGRLNLLTNVCGKPLEALLCEFKGVQEDQVAFPGWDQGDVKYHLGSRQKLTLRNGREVWVELLNNPSHLETVNPVVQGYARAAQKARKNSDNKHGKGLTLPVEIHGDAAISGQGVVYETMGISAIGRFHTGGTIHVVVNNQIGFTTDPTASRSSTHCSDLARVFQAPVLHVNGDCPEEVVRVFQLAVDYRNSFGRSVVIDLVCYRRFGHNEGDSPSFTQPLMYKAIEKRESVLDLYTKQLLAMKTPPITADRMKALQDEAKTRFRTAWENVEKKRFNYLEYQKECVPVPWRKYVYDDPMMPQMNPTNVAKEDLAPVIEALQKMPKGFDVHRTLQGIFEKRTKSLQSGEGLEWGTCEALAFGTMLTKEKYAVRVSGQDAERATFSQRHAVVHDQTTDALYIPLANIHKDQAPFVVTNSALSEYAVLGFEVGYALRDPNNFVMWEAQYGDFANGAQIMIDQYVAASQAKWRQPCSTVISLPHGYDGGGPEHSSGRIERFMQLANEDETTPEMSVVERHYNCHIAVVHPTTPAQYFHVLRRHMNRNFRRPLAVFFSKAHLRAPNVSSMDELINGHFQVVIPDTNADAVAHEKVRRVLFCYGQMYYMLEKERAKRGANDVAIIRLEELAPMPVREMAEQVAKYPNAEVAWCQEEGKNMGPWAFVRPHFQRMVRARPDGANKAPVRYVGRALSPSVSTGFKSVHDAENDMILEAAFQA